MAFPFKRLVQLLPPPPHSVVLGPAVELLLLPLVAVAAWVPVPLVPPVLPNLAVAAAVDVGQPQAIPVLHAPLLLVQPTVPLLLVQAAVAVPLHCTNHHRPSRNRKQKLAPSL